MTSTEQSHKIDYLIDTWRRSPLWRHVVDHRVVEGTSAQLAPMPEWVDRRLVRALATRGVNHLYTHQLDAAEATRAGRDVVIATPTASGKTLCYSLPVFQQLLAEPQARALYLFPTKALARDQVEEARALAAELDEPIGVAVYDGDTPPDQRRAARRGARILATNPEMLHAGILPHHTAWSELLAGLRYVVIDELHVYRGVFGSHVAHVLRRLRRLARFHGADPVFVSSSATIANPAELAELLTGRPTRLVKRNGAPRGPRHVLIYNPPVVDSALGIRQSYLKATCSLARRIHRAGVDSLVFCRSRLAVEVMLRYLRDDVRQSGDRQSGDAGGSIRGYRGGYLPDRRREVERGLREGDARMVVTTSALELGIDIGAIDAVVVAGWPGSRAALWQRAGRAGRRLAPSLGVLVASSEPLDQYVAGDPDYLFGQSPEHARIDPDNASILVPHVKCAAYELPFSADESYGELAAAETTEVLDCLADASLLHRGPAGTFHYVDEAYPANDVNLRGPLDENFLVVRVEGDQRWRGDSAAAHGTVIAEVPYADAPQELHEQAIYQLEGRQYQVLRLDHDNRKGYVAEVDIDYYTDAMTQTQVRVIARQQPADVDSGVTACQGEVHLVNRVVGFKKIKLHSRENIGYGEVHQPDREMHTSALWLTVPPRELSRLARTPAEIADATLALARALHSAASLLLMTDTRDLGKAVGDARSAWFPVLGRSGHRSGGDQERSDDEAPMTPGPYAPTIFLFDRYPGGTGLAQRLYDERRHLLGQTHQIVARCGCKRGCPACIGPTLSAPGEGGGEQISELKTTALKLIELIEAGLDPIGFATKTSEPPVLRVVAPPEQRGEL